VSRATCGLYRNSRGTEPGYEYYIRANDMSSKRYTIAMYTVPIARSYIYFRNVVAKLSRRFLARGVFQNAIIPAAGVCDAVCIFYLARPLRRDIFVVIIIQGGSFKCKHSFFRRTLTFLDIFPLNNLKALRNNTLHYATKLYKKNISICVWYYFLRKTIVYL